MHLFLNYACRKENNGKKNVVDILLKTTKRIRKFLKMKMLS